MTGINKQTFKKFIASFDFATLFNELGWDYLNEDIYKKIDDKTFALKSIAHKEGFRIFVCNLDEEGNIPDSNLRKKIHSEISKLFFEHLIVFIDKDKNKQIWQLVIKEQGKPHRVRSVDWNTHQEPERLYQRLSGVFFTIDEQDKLTIVDVTQRLKENFGANAEKVTKKFYDEFKRQHTKFLKFLKGIEDTISRDWYASLMLNRLMFCYFIQKKGFLNNDRNYLRTKLKEVQAQKGKDKFFKFYYDFLKTLFHQGLGAPDHSAEIKKLLGNIPYLNGGLFDVHSLEREYPKIQIDDAAFEHIFNFFDEWEWHLDVRPDATGNEINPDVIGYIFEQYINAKERGEKGTYYTKEDITDYISKNCIIPFLFDETKRQYSKAFAPDGKLLQIVKSSNDNYIYDAVKYGTEKELPKEILAGIKNVSERTEGNKHAPSEYALPTETWREVVERRKRFSEIKNKIQKGEISSINDFITYNLNIRQFAIDCIANTNDAEFLKEFYKSLTKVTVIDPTCGSGAFLFAAMNVLEELYEACIQRMEEFREEAEGKYKFFEETLAQVKSSEHPNLQYFIYKSIILRNIYGVDIMNEAVEIAKLRLFLKLVATVEVDYSKKNLGLEPLPDIDFNIRAGNSLVGFASKKDVEYASRFMIDGADMIAPIDEKSEMVARTFERYKEIQLTYGDDYKQFKKAKEELDKRLKELNHELNQLLHKQAMAHKYEKWLETYKPFHWYSEFYEIIHDRGGFDIVIGNPPYIPMKKIDYDLKISDFRCSDLFGFVIRRCFQILNKNSRYGFIVMHNLAFSRNFPDARKAIKKNAVNAWFSFYGRIPAGLFSGDVRVRNCIFLIDKKEPKEEKQFFTTRIHRWFSEARINLLQKLNYTQFDFADIIPMFNGETLADFFQSSNGKTLSHYEQSISKHQLYFKQSAYNWVAVSNAPAPCYDGKGKKIPQSKVSSISFNSEDVVKFSLLFLNGKLFFSKWFTYGDEFDVTRDDLTSVKVPFETIEPSDKKNLNKLAEQFKKGLKDTIQYKLNAGKNVGTFNTSKLWHITDQSDKIFLKYLCSNPEEVFDAIESHIKQTVITVEDEDEE